MWGAGNTEDEARHIQMSQGCTEGHGRAVPPGTSTVVQGCLCTLPRFEGMEQGCMSRSCTGRPEGSPHAQSPLFFPTKPILAVPHEIHRGSSDHQHCSSLLDLIYKEWSVISPVAPHPTVTTTSGCWWLILTGRSFCLISFIQLVILSFILYSQKLLLAASTGWEPSSTGIPHDPKTTVLAGTKPQPYAKGTHLNSNCITRLNIK